MTDRAETIVVRDAAQVYAEGVYAGLKTARVALLRAGLAVPPSLTRSLREWECNAIHFEWLARQGEPVPVGQSEEVRTLIEAAMRAAGLGSFGDGR